MSDRQQLKEVLSVSKKVSVYSQGSSISLAHKLPPEGGGPHRCLFSFSFQNFSSPECSAPSYNCSGIGEKRESAAVCRWGSEFEIHAARMHGPVLLKLRTEALILDKYEIQLK